MLAAGRAPARTHDEVRRHNLGRLLRLVHLRGAVSRSELTTRTGLNRSTVKGLIEDLVAGGLVRQSAPLARSGAGRPSLTVEPASDRVFVLALDVGVEHLTAVRVGLGGTVLDRRRLPQARRDYDVGRTRDRLRRLGTALLDAAPPGATCAGIGVGVSGLVRADDGVVRFGPNLGWVDVPLRDLVAEALGTDLPVAVGNDADVGAVAEHLRGAGRGCSDVVFLAGEIGVGAGVILDGRPLRGAGGYGGEVGHMSIDPRGRRCGCGRRGCWETEIGDAAVLRSVGAPPGTPLEGVVQAYAAGETWVQPGMHRVARALGLGIANLVNVFNPQLIVFGGTARHVFLAVEPLVRAAAAEALPASAEQVRLEVTALGDDVTALGAAELAFARLLDDPLAALDALRVVPASPA